MKTVMMTTLIGVSALTLSACGASTGGITNALAQKAASSAITTAMQRDTASQDDFVAPVSIASPKAGDAKLSCDAIETKLVALEAIIIESGEVAGEDISMASQQAATAAVAQGAVSLGMQAGVAKAVPFLNMFGQQAIEASAKSKAKKVKKARKAYQAATSRRATLMGVYAGKGCDG
ncbi:hypothetical protein [Fretibacter rubidus]|uniref:hypothetical protein n=1 Tax=Fretibacter rubidus TaxID=570162 RepID=UPI00352A5515